MNYIALHACAPTPASCIREQRVGPEPGIPPEAQHLSSPEWPPVDALVAAYEPIGEVPPLKREAGKAHPPPIAFGVEVFDNVNKAGHLEPVARVHVSAPFHTRQGPG